MSYPQPDSNAPVLNGQNFWRLNTPVASPGDIYESEQGAAAWAIGPESDFSRVAIDYYDPTQSPTFMNTVTISTDRAFVGTVQAGNDSSYQPANVPGRTLIRPIDLYNPSIDLATILGYPLGSSYFLAPQLDVIQYFSPVSGPSPARNDKSYDLQRIQTAAGTYGIVIPFYGRRFATYRFYNDAATNQSFGLAGINYQIGDTNNGNLVGGAFIYPVTSLAAGARKDGVIDTSTFGTFDALVATIITTGNKKFSCRIDVSDRRG